MEVFHLPVPNSSTWTTVYLGEQRLTRSCRPVAMNTGLSRRREEPLPGPARRARYSIFNYIFV